jgi:hypothetical protein
MFKNIYSFSSDLSFKGALPQFKLIPKYLELGIAFPLKYTTAAGYVM